MNLFVNLFFEYNFSIQEHKISSELKLVLPCGVIDIHRLPVDRVLLLYEGLSYLCKNLSINMNTRINAIWIL